MPRYRDEDGNWHQDRRGSQRQPGEYGQSWEVAACLWDGPRTPDGIADHFRSYLRWMGLFSITERFERGWLVGSERLSVTDAGRKRLRRQMSEARGKTWLAGLRRARG